MPQIGSLKLKQRWDQMEDLTLKLYNVPNSLMTNSAVQTSRKHYLSYLKSRQPCLEKKDEAQGAHRAHDELGRCSHVDGTETKIKGRLCLCQL